MIPLIHYSTTNEFELSGYDLKQNLERANDYLRFEDIILFPDEQKLGSTGIFLYDQRDASHVEIISNSINKIEFVCASPFSIKQACNEFINVINKLIERDRLSNDEVIKLDYDYKYCRKKEKEFNPNRYIGFENETTLYIYLNNEVVAALNHLYDNILKFEAYGVAFDSMKIRSEFWGEIAEKIETILIKHEESRPKTRRLPNTSDNIPPRLILEFVEIFLQNQYASETTIGIIEQYLLDSLGIDRTKYKSTKFKYKEVNDKFKVIQELIDKKLPTIK